LTTGQPADAAFMFVDLCGGPGGFSEYLGAKGRGFGITLRIDDGCDWSSRIQPPGGVASSDARLTISYGADGTGNLYSVANIKHFRDLVRGAVPHGVNLVVADGGFTEARDSHQQETIMHRLVLAQIAAMVEVLECGGSFVLKLFELLTPCTCSLYYVAHRLFDSVQLVKPVTSRPASSERYMVCHGFRPGTARITEHLVGILEESSRGGAVQPAVGTEIMEEDTAFMEHLRASNTELGQRQLAACQALLEHAKSAEHTGAGAPQRDSLQLRLRVLREWGLACEYS